MNPTSPVSPEFLSRTKTSSRLFAEAKTLIPGGVNSPVRAFGSVGGSPLFIKKARGSRIWDVDGNEFIDYVGSWGPAILGHAHPEVIKAVQDAAENGLSYGAPTEGESTLVKMLQSALPGLDMVRLVTSGTEACMSALRVARAFTGRSKILKFDGCYHGHADMLLVKAGSGVATFGLSGTKGVPDDAARHTLTAPFNDLTAVEQIFAANKGEIAAVILEPHVGNAGYIAPQPGFLQGLRDITKAHGAVLIFDEVMTGFRVAWGGAQVLAGIIPDMTVLGKVIGGGMPIGAYGGRREIMELVAPAGPVYQAGTLSGHPVAVACGIKTLEILGKSGTFGRLQERTGQLVKGLSELARQRQIPFIADSVGGMFGFFFHPGPVRNYGEARQGDSARFNRFFWGMLERGVYFAPSAFEAGFVSLAHDNADVHKTLEHASHVMDTLR
jgi:glutamate-1-semialdehyde 2,1-aminomutase